MKIVIDTGILVSAAWRDRLPEQVVECVVNRALVGWQWIATESILDEYARVLQRPKFHLRAGVLAYWLDRIRTATVLVEADVAVSFPRDQKDAKFLACAIANGADWFITGDRDFEDARQLVNTKIVQAALFHRLMCEVEATEGAADG